MIKLSNSFKLNKIHIVDSPFNEDPKNIIFSRETLISREGWQENLWIMGNNGHLLLCKSGGGEYRKRISAPTSWYQNPCDASIFLHARLNFREKNEKYQFSGQNLTFL